MGNRDRDPWLVFRDLHCLHCGYNLRRQTGPQITCPECGSVNDLRDPKQWRPQLDDGTPLDFTTLVGIGAMAWVFPALQIFLILVAIEKKTDLAVWLLALLYIAITIAHARFLLGSLKKRIHQIDHLPKAIFIFALATLVTAGPFLSMLLAYLGGYLLKWQWPIAIAAGFVASYLAFDIGTKLMPDTKEKYRLPPWMRYCEAIKSQAKQGKFKE